MDVHAAPVELDAVCDVRRADVRPVAEQKGLEFGSSVDPTARRPSVVTDEQRLQQVLRNLLSNAFKFTDDGQVALRVAGRRPTRCSTATTRRCRSGRRVRGHDTGIGIADGQAAADLRGLPAGRRHHQPPLRRHGPRPSIRREIARLLGGEIHVESEPGEGSTFTLYLPLRRAAAESPTEPPALDAGAAPGATPAPARPGAGRARRSRCRDELERRPRRASRRATACCSIVEDDAALRAIAARRWRASAASRCIGGAARRGRPGAGAEYRPDAIVLDIGLPDIDGWACCEHLKHHPETRHIPVHIVSAASGGSDALRAGAVGYVEKPVEQRRADAVLREPRAASSSAACARCCGRGRRGAARGDRRADRRRRRRDHRGRPQRGGAEALASSAFDCMVLDLKLPDMSGFELLERDQRATSASRDLPVIVYTGQRPHARGGDAAPAVRRDDHRQGRALARAAARRDRAVPAPRRVAAAGRASAACSSSCTPPTPCSQGKKVLIVDDDVRNIFALASALESHGHARCCSPRTGARRSRCSTQIPTSTSC